MVLLFARIEIHGATIYNDLGGSAALVCQAIVKQSGSLAPESPEFLDRSYYVRNVYDKD